MYVYEITLHTHTHKPFQTVIENEKFCGCVMRVSFHLDMAHNVIIFIELLSINKYNSKLVHCVQNMNFKEDPFKRWGQDMVSTWKNVS